MSNLRIDCISRDGGKITEKANAGSNVSDIRFRNEIHKTKLKAPHKGVLLNSVCLNDVVHRSFRNRYIVQDLFGVRHMTTSSQLILMETRKEQVEIKQRELVQLAKLKGTYDKEVLNRQLLLARSKLFREHAVELISLKPGYQTPGVDKEVYEKDKEESFDQLVKYLREMTYHPNQYQAKPVKRV